MESITLSELWAHMTNYKYSSYAGVPNLTEIQRDYKRQEFQNKYSGKRIEICSSIYDIESYEYSKNQIVIKIEDYIVENKKKYYAPRFVTLYFLFDKELSFQYLSFSKGDKVKIVGEIIRTFDPFQISLNLISIEKINT